MSAPQDFRTWAANSTIAHVAFGFLMMGGWALFANRHHPLPQALLSGVVQGAISGALTLFLKKGLEQMNAMFRTARSSDENIGKNLAALIAPPIITATLIFIILISAHTLAGTPEIAATIAVPFTVSTSYAVLYNYGLWSRMHGR
jgi:hypothetical protein